MTLPRTEEEGMSERTDSERLMKTAIVRTL